VRSGTTWTQQAKLTPSEQFYLGGFGWSVAVQGDVAVIGAPYAGDETTGLTYIFSRSGTTWTERAVGSQRLRVRVPAVTSGLAGGFLELVPRVLQLPE